nr:MAG: hypothetical protein [Sesarmops intermedium nimavirus]
MNASILLAISVCFLKPSIRFPITSVQVDDSRARVQESTSFVSARNFTLHKITNLMNPAREKSYICRA